MTCLEPYEMFTFFQPYVLLLTYSVFCMSIIWKHKTSFIHSYKNNKLISSEILCCVLQFVKHKTSI